MNHSRFISLPLLLISILFNGVIAAEVVIVNRPAAEDDLRYVYAHRLITMALDVTRGEYGPAEIILADQTMIRMRALRELQAGNNIHVMAEATQPLWEEKLIPIRIPIRKGISGYRVFLINQENQELISNIASLMELKKLPTGMVGQWSVAQIFKDAQFNNIFATNYQGLFAMLAAGRFVTFNRGIDEIFEEYSTYKEQYPSLHIEEDLLLRIPMPIYIFVTPTKPELAERIEKGLNILIDSGEFDAHFLDFYGDFIEQAHLSERRVFHIPNNSLSNETPFNIPHYWY